METSLFRRSSQGGLHATVEPDGCTKARERSHDSFGLERRGPEAPGFREVLEGRRSATGLQRGDHRLAHARDSPKLTELRLNDVRRLGPNGGRRVGTVVGRRSRMSASVSA